jgi:hypothetical protein
MDNEKIDLSSLDPSRDESRWNDLISAIARRAREARQRRLSVPYQLLAWARPAVAMAAAIALVVVVGASLSRYAAQTKSVNTVKPALMLTVWAATDVHPSTAAMLELLGGARGEK